MDVWTGGSTCRYFGGKRSLSDVYFLLKKKQVGFLVVCHSSGRSDAKQSLVWISSYYWLNLPPCASALNFVRGRYMHKETQLTVSWEGKMEQDKRRIGQCELPDWWLAAEVTARTDALVLGLMAYFTRGDQRICNNPVSNTQKWAQNTWNGYTWQRGHLEKGEARQMITKAL